MTDLVEKELSNELDVKVTWEDAKLKLELGYDGKGADAGVYVKLEAEYLLKKIAEAIPGEVDDMVLNAILAAAK